jgi:hypothetical protein
MMGQKAIKELTGRSVGITPGSNCSATGPRIQTGIDKQKTSRKKVKGDLFPDTPFKRYLFMVDAPFPTCQVGASSRWWQGGFPDRLHSMDLGPLYRWDGAMSFPKRGIPLGILRGKRGRNLGWR